MHIITKKRIKEAQELYPEAKSSLEGWYKIMKKNIFPNFDSLKKTFNTVDKVGKFHVFDIAGNKLRLIAVIHHNRKKVYIKKILSHKEYDEDQWKK